MNFLSLILAAVAAQRPLPDDLPAAALWWRLTPHLAPAAVAAGPGTTVVRPDWYTALLTLLPDEHGQRVLATPAWPALVAAVTVGIRDGWSPTDLLTAVVAGLPSADGGDRTGNELAETLVFRIAALTDPERELVASWAAPPTWHPGHIHPGRGRYLIKSGQRIGLPVGLRLTPTEARLYDTDTAFRTHP